MRQALIDGNVQPSQPHGYKRQRHNARVLHDTIQLWFGVPKE